MPSLSACCLAGTLDVGYLLVASAPDLGRGLSPLGCSPLQRHAATAHHPLLSKEVSDIVQETGIKRIPKKKKCKTAKWLSEEALETAVKRSEAKKQRRKQKIYPFECRVPKNSKEKEIRRNNNNSKESLPQ